MARDEDDPVLMIASKVPPDYGGAGAQALALARHMAASGTSVTVLAQRHPGESRRQRLEGVHLRLAGSSERPRNRLARAWRTAWFMVVAFTAVVSVRPRVVHLHGAYWFTVAAALACQMRKVPYIVKVTRLGEDDPRSVFGRTVWGLPLGWLYGYPFRHASAVIALSREILQSCTTSIPEVPSHLIPNGVDTSFFRPPTDEERTSARKSLRIDASAFHVVQSGYVVPHKGTDTLVDAWIRVQPGLPAHSTLLLAGPFQGLGAESDQDFTRYISEAAQRSGTIALLGHVDQEMLRRCFWAADAFALVSHYEGLPNSLLEAMACGLPPLVTTVAGTMDVVDGLDGVKLVQVGDVAGTATAIRELHDLSEPSARALRTTCRSRIMEGFGIAAISERYLRLYRDLSGA